MARFESEILLNSQVLTAAAPIENAKNSPYRIKSNNIVFLAGRGNTPLAREVTDLLGKPLYTPASSFADGESDVKIDVESVDFTGIDVFISQSTQPKVTPDGLGVNDHVMELYFMNKAAKRAGANRVVDIIPYYGYGRGDADNPGRTLTAADVARLLTKRTRVKRLMSVDLHNPAVKMAVEKPWDNLYASRSLVPVIRNRLKQHGEFDNAVIVSPDNGAVRRSSAFAREIGIRSLAIIHKHRPEDEKDKSEVVEVVGDVKGKVAVVVDDIANTLGTAVHGAIGLMERGAKRVIFVGVHGILSGDALKYLQNPALDHAYLMNTIELRPEVMQQVGEVIANPFDEESYKDTENPDKKLTIVSVAPQLAKTIYTYVATKKRNNHPNKH